MSQKWAGAWQFGQDSAAHLQQNGSNEQHVLVSAELVLNVSCQLESDGGRGSVLNPRCSNGSVKYKTDT